MCNIIHLNQDDPTPAPPLECEVNSPSTSMDERSQAPTKPRKPTSLRPWQRTLRYLSSRYKATRRFFHRHLGRWYIRRLVALAMYLDRPGFNIFVTVHDRVDRIVLTIYPQGWSKDGTRIMLINAPLPGSLRQNAITPRDIARASTAIRALSRIQAWPFVDL